MPAPDEEFRRTPTFPVRPDGKPDQRNGSGKMLAADNPPTVTYTTTRHRQQKRGAGAGAPIGEVGSLHIASSLHPFVTREDISVPGGSPDDRELESEVNRVEEADYGDRQGEEPVGRMPKRCRARATMKMPASEEAGELTYRQSVFQPSPLMTGYWGRRPG